MATPNVKTQSGNRVVVQFDGKQIGLMQSVSMNDDYNPEPATGIGDIEVQEYVPTRATYSLNVSKMVLRKKDMREVGITTLDSETALQGLVFDIVVLDRETGGELRKYMGCSFASGDVEVRANAIVSANARFNALRAAGTGL